MANNVLTEEGYLSSLDRPYQANDLQRRFAGMSLRDIYTFLCKKLSCRVNSGVMKMLSDRPGEYEMTIMDVSRNYLGHRGVVPVLELTKLLPKLKTVNLADNFLDNNSVHHLSKVLVHHPTVAVVDVSENPITWCAGMCLLELAQRNPGISKINVSRTMLKEKVVETITARCRNNLVDGRVKRRAPNPTNHQTTIQIRALKRLYRELAGTTGLVGKRSVIQGLKELYRLKGNEDAIKDMPIDTFDDAVKRTNSAGADGTPEGCIDWECFLIVVLTSCEYDKILVTRLHQIFQLFDVDGVGFIDACDLKEVLAMLSEDKAVAPTDDEVRQRLELLDADATMTLSWEELLYIAYNRTPTEIGDVVVLPTSTPMPRPPIAHH